MHLDELKSILSTSINPDIQFDKKYRLASILVIIYGDDPIIVMTEKPQDMKFHAGEISFPGGKLDENDSDLLETALRETNEEIGLVVTRDQVIGQLEPVVTLNSGFLILPFVSIVDKIPTLSANCEVEKIFHIPLESFLKTGARDPDPTHNIIQEMYTFEYQNQIVWGASARILKQIQSCLKS
ncbi:MAG: CoA pyrophosphatase [Nitrosopumilus sp.]|nr:CoA pyrophosphatase [Nitrosopumilus sp.]MDH3489508.1 CoA pyrophosphatase [Nitrosopumilus sp.]MDH3516506.1 CoA pyrophosphatase [Nitrosopumilus sp.]MDH3564972.1 CoA pyrophosphatase [Nitrosopumilus sp.]MDH5416395.1 CoA pyrophosphatase [Nitrosopumilus sp.]